MALTRAELTALNNSTFPNNNTGQINPEGHRSFNEDVLDYVDANAGEGPLEDLGTVDNYSEEIPTLKPTQVITLQNSTARKITFDINSFEAGDNCFVIAPGGYEPLPDTVQGSDGPYDTWPYYIGWEPGAPDPNPSPSSGDPYVRWVYTCVRLQNDGGGMANMYVTRSSFRTGELTTGGGSVSGGSGSGGI